MKSDRYIAKYEPGNDWGVYDCNRQCFVTGGLTEDEAKEAANDNNAKDRVEKSKFV